MIYSRSKIKPRYSASKLSDFVYAVLFTIVKMEYCGIRKLVVVVVVIAVAVESQ